MTPQSGPANTAPPGLDKLLPNPKARLREQVREVMRWQVI